MEMKSAWSVATSLTDERAITIQNGESVAGRYDECNVQYLFAGHLATKAPVDDGCKHKHYWHYNQYYTVKQEF